MWNPRGRELFYRNGEKMMSVVIGDKPEDTSKPAVVFEGNYAFGEGLTIAAYDVAPDGERFLMVKEESSVLGNVRVVLNWFDELERLAPTH